MAKKRTAKTNPDADLDLSDRAVDPLDDPLAALRRDEEEIDKLLRWLQEHEGRQVDDLLEKLAPAVCPYCGRPMAKCQPKP